MTRALLLALPLLLLPAGLHAQQDEAPDNRRRAAWLSDRLDYAEGDLITIVIEESASATGRSRDHDAERRGTSAEVGAEISMLPSLPSASVGSGTENEHRKDRTVMRRNQLSATMAVRVVEVTPSGDLRVEGEREVRVDGNIETMYLSGWLRPEDVSPSALAPSSRLADARIVYKGKKPFFRGGFLGRILGALWP